MIKNYISFIDVIEERIEAKKTVLERGIQTANDLVEEIKTTQGGQIKDARQKEYERIADINDMLNEEIKRLEAGNYESEERRLIRTMQKEIKRLKEKEIAKLKSMIEAQREGRLEFGRGKIKIKPKKETGEEE